jgi:hypothetical protein
MRPTLPCALRDSYVCSLNFSLLAPDTLKRELQTGDLEVSRISRCTRRPLRRNIGLEHSKFNGGSFRLRVHPAARVPGASAISFGGIERGKTG